MPGRLLVDVVDFFVSGQHSNAEARDVASHRDRKPKEVETAMKELEKRSILKPMGAGVYNFAPESNVSHQLQQFFKRWHTSDEHSRLLMQVLAVEK